MAVSKKNSVETRTDCSSHGMAVVKFTTERRLFVIKEIILADFLDGKGEAPFLHQPQPGHSPEALGELLCMRKIKGK